MRGEDDYVHFWGLQGFRGVQERVRIIEAQSLEIVRHLPEEKKLSGLLSDLSVFRKVAFALVNSAALKDRISRMKDMVADLDDYSATQFAKTHDCNPKGQAAGDPLTELLQLKDRREEFSSWMNRLHEEQLSRPDSWNLMLQIPADKDGIVPDETDLPVDFLIEQITGDHSTARIEKLVYNRENAEPLTPLLPIEIIGSHPTPIKVSRQPFSASAFTQSEQKSMENERSQAALGLATWTFPLVHTGWTTNLCSCIIHLAVYEENSRISVLGSGRPQRCRTHERNEDLRSHTCLFLGTTLAELILAEPLRVGIEANMEKNELEAVFQAEEREFNEVILLRKIEKKSAVYMQAVKYCFELDREMMRSQVWAQDTERFIVRVLKP